MSHSPTILEALEGNLPLQVQSNEQSFLEDFISCVPGSSGGRLARYFNSLKYVHDSCYSSLILSRSFLRVLKGFYPFFFRWLQPDSYADPQKTSLILNKDDIRCGWPTIITVQTKDQYGEVVHVPNMKVKVHEIKIHSLIFLNNIFNTSY